MSPRWNSTLPLSLALVAAFCNMIMATRWAAGEDQILGGVESISLPPPTARPLGFKTQVELGVENAVAYLPVRITFNAIGRLASDRRLVYRFETLTGAQTPPRNGLSIDVPITVRQGTTSQSFHRYLPKWSAGRGLVVTVWEDGRQLEDYTDLIAPRILGGNRLRPLLRSEYEIDWVFIGPEDLPLESNLAEHDELVITSYFQSQGTVALKEEAEQVRKHKDFGVNFLTIGQKGLPEDWRGYQNHDVVVLGSESIQLMKQRPKAMQALRGWVLTGGTIAIHDPQSRQAALDLLDFRSTRPLKSEKAIQNVAVETVYELHKSRAALAERIKLIERYIQLVNASSGEDQLLGQLSNTDLAYLHEGYGGDIEPAKEDLLIERRRHQRFPQPSTKVADHIWIQGVGAGRVIGHRESDEFAVPPVIFWKTVAKSMQYRASPMIRRGVDPMMGDRRFARWLIPGVAEPPVYTFMGLLTMFVVLVGPVAYRRTTRHGRSHLMFAIAPALALLTTVAMFSYGIVSDGFGTMARTRQLTWVDGKSGDAAERVRATYFAGVRPTTGLRFAGDAEVIGYPNGAGLPWQELADLSPATLGSVRIDEQSQVFEASFLPAREQRQFVTHAPRYQVGQLQLNFGPDPAAPPTVKSGFDFPIQEAVIRDVEGGYWSVTNLQPGATMTCREVKTENSSKILGRMYNDHRPLSRVRETSDKKRRYDNRIYDMIVDANRQIESSQTLLEGTFEYWLQAHMQTMGEIPIDHFVAIADVSDDVLSVQRSELAASVRYVFGTLR